MLDFNDVFDGFKQLAGLDDDCAQDGFTLIINMSIFEVEAMVGSEQTLSDHSDRLCAAASAFAYYKYCQLSASEGGFKAGDLTLTQPNAANAIAAAKALRDDAVASIYDLVCGNFYFGQV